MYIVDSYIGPETGFPNPGLIFSEYNVNALNNIRGWPYCILRSGFIKSYTINHLNGRG